MDDVVARVTAAVGRGHAGERAAARNDLEVLWAESVGDAFHRCVVAHFLADLQDDAHAELMWDERALAAVDEVTQERVAEFHPSMQVRAWMPSLYCSLADDHRRLGDPARARSFLDRALAASDALGDDAYGALVRGFLEKEGRALAEGSTASLPSA